jgi:hypothetical protein
MAQWPNIVGPSAFSYNPVRPQLRTEFENGVVHSRSRVTRTRRVYSLGWGAMPTADKDALEAFFDEYQGRVFTFPVPTTQGREVKARFASDRLSISYAAPGRWQVRVELEEA